MHVILWSASSHTPRAMWLVQIGALCIVARGETGWIDTGL